MTDARQISDLVYSDVPAVFILGSDRAAVDRARATVAAIAARPLGGGGLADAERVHARVVWCEIGEEVGEEAAMLDAVRRGAEADRWRAVVAAPAARLDEIVAGAWHPAVDMLLDAGPADRMAALGAALAAAERRATPVLHEGGERGEVDRLRRLTEEVGRIAHTLARISGEPVAAVRPPAGGRSAATPPKAETVRAVVRARRLRAQNFDTELFADPAWDMLLDLYAARLDQHRVAVSSLCIASAVPATTALRWIKTLTDRGLFVRRADPTDGRRVFIELADGAADALTAYFAELERQVAGTPWGGATLAA